MPAPVRVRVDLRALRKLRERAGDVLTALDRPVGGAVKRAVSLAQTQVPVETGELRRSVFVSGPLHNMGPSLSASWTGGYAFAEAGPIHEGFHGGTQKINPPPHWLKDAFRGTRSVARKGVATALRRWMERNFPRT